MTRISRYEEILMPSARVTFLMKLDTWGERQLLLLPQNQWSIAAALNLAGI